MNDYLINNSIPATTYTSNDLNITLLFSDVLEKLKIAYNFYDEWVLLIDYLFLIVDTNDSEYDSMVEGILTSYTLRILEEGISSSKPGRWSKILRILCRSLAKSSKVNNDQCEYLVLSKVIDDAIVVLKEKLTSDTENMITCAATFLFNFWKINEYWLRCTQNRGILAWIANILKQLETYQSESGLKQTIYCLMVYGCKNAQEKFIHEVKLLTKYIVPEMSVKSEYLINALQWVKLLTVKYDTYVSMLADVDGFMDKLLCMITHEDKEVQAYIISIIGNICATTDNERIWTIVTEVFPKILSFAFEGDLEIAHDVIWTIGNLLKSDEKIAEIVKSNYRLSLALSNLLTFNDLDIKYETMWCIYTIIHKRYDDVIQKLFDQSLLDIIKEELNNNSSVDMNSILIKILYQLYEYGNTEHSENPIIEEFIEIGGLEALERVHEKTTNEELGKVMFKLIEWLNHRDNSFFDDIDTSQLEF